MPVNLQCIACKRIHYFSSSDAERLFYTLQAIISDDNEEFVDKDEACPLKIAQLSEYFNYVDDRVELRQKAVLIAKSLRPQQRWRKYKERRT